MTYTVQTSPNVTTWADLTVNPGSDGEIVTVISTNDSDRFIRLPVAQ